MALNKIINDFIESNGKSLTSNGYIKLEDGLIIQWASGSGATTQVSQIVTFPIAFPNACLAAFVDARAVNFSDAQNAWFLIRSFSTTSAIVHAQSTSTSWVDPLIPDVFAIGY